MTEKEERGMMSFFVCPRSKKMYKISASQNEYTCPDCGQLIILTHAENVSRNIQAIEQSETI